MALGTLQHGLTLGIPRRRHARSQPRSTAHSWARPAPLFVQWNYGSVEDVRLHQASGTGSRPSGCVARSESVRNDQKKIKKCPRPESHWGRRHVRPPRRMRARNRAEPRKLLSSGVFLPGIGLILAAATKALDRSRTGVAP